MPHYVFKTIEIRFVLDGEVIVNYVVKEVIICGDQGRPLHKHHHQEFVEHDVVGDE